MSWNSTLTRRTPLRAKKPWQKGGKIDRNSVKTPKKQKPMKRVGKRTAAWDSLRARMKPEFERAGIVGCECRYQGCAGLTMLSFAHSKKRRNVVGAELEECALACIPCHDVLELLPEEQMSARVRTIIAAREVAVRSVWKG